MDVEFYVVQLRRCLELLSDEDRAVLILHYFCGLSAAEIARLLITTRSAVLVRLHRARQRLRSFLEVPNTCFVV